MATFNAQLPSGGQLNPGDNVVSPNLRYSLLMQHDGNLNLLDVRDPNNPQSLWASNTHGKAVNFCMMQTDGNLVIVGFPDLVWASNTDGHPNSFLQVQDDGNVVIVQPLCAVWATNTVQP